jgi:hypothetical protein
MTNIMIQSALAHEALHNAYSLIDPKLLSLKSFSEHLTFNNSFPIDTYRLLIYLGFWKKVVFTYQTKMSMQLCIKFFDIEHFMILKEHAGIESDSDKQLVQEWENHLHLKLFYNELVE